MLMLKCNLLLMKEYCFVLFLVMLFNQSFAQPDPVGAFNRHIAANWTGEYVRISQYRVKGTPYLLGESFPGAITYKGGKTADNNKILYNLYNQKAGIDLKNDIYESGEEVEQFTLHLPEKFGGQTLLFKNANLYGDAKVNGYLNVLEEGNKIAFLKAYKIKLSPDPTNTLVKDVKVFEQYYEYYLYNKISKELHKVKLKEKDIRKELGNEELVKSYTASQAADLSKEADIIKLVKYFNNNL
jgi:hypothetical protein